MFSPCIVSYSSQPIPLADDGQSDPRLLSYPHENITNKQTNKQKTRTTIKEKCHKVQRYLWKEMQICKSSLQENIIRVTIITMLFKAFTDTGL